MSKKKEKMDLSSTSGGKKPLIFGYVSLLSIEVRS